PEILLAEPDDVILLGPPLVVKGFILGNEVFIRASSDRAGDTAHVVLRASVEDVRHIPHSNAVADFETGRGVGRSQSFIFFHSETSPPQSCLAARSARCVFCRRASGPRTKSSVRNRACQDRAYNPNHYRPGDASLRRSICPASQAPRMSHTY